MKKNNDGFTLIELLAVIVILAVIALIAVPIILGVIDNAKKEAFKDTAYGIIDAAEQYYAKEILKGRSITEKTFNFPDDNELKFNGTKPDWGALKINNQGKIKLALYNGNFCYVKDYNDNVVTLVELPKEECTILEPYVDEVLNGADPVLDPGMIPVTIENNGTVKKADIYNKWYDYTNRQWANVVLVSSDVRDSYKKGDTIPESKILAYFVWVPRYEYETITSTTPTEIKINIIPNTVTSPSEGYILHPAFKYGDKELNGIWVGKFETSGTVSAPRIKPNVAAQGSQVVSDKFVSSLIMGNRTFNADGTITNNPDKTTYGLMAESRMMKNIEWGAVVYFTQSRYGRCVNGTCTEVSVNNSSNKITGSSAGRPADTSTKSSTVYAYNTLQGYLASTTGNIYGIYDMAGGLVEHVMGVLKDTSGNPYSGDSSTHNSNFKGKYYSGGQNTTGLNFPVDEKYYDAYEYSIGLTNYSKTKIGDATKETSEWYGDWNWNFNSQPWYSRGGAAGNNQLAGIFAFKEHSGTGGDLSGNPTYRIVVTN